MEKIMMVLFIPVFFLILYISGSLTNRIFKMQADPIQKLVYGFLLVLAVFQIAATPFMLLKTAFTPLFFCFLGIMLLIAAAGLGFCRKDMANDFRQIWTKFRHLNIGTIIVLTLIVLQIVAVTVLQHTDDDDGFYVTITSTAVQQNAVFQFEQSMGFANLPYMSMYVNGIELLYAFFSKLFFIHPAVFVHMVMPVVLIPLAYGAYYCIAKSMQNTTMRLFFLGAICLMNIFGYFSVFSPSSFLLLRIWQGKAILVNIILPVMYSAFIPLCEKKYTTSLREGIDKNEINKAAWMLAMVSLASVCAANVALFLIPAALVSVLIPCMIMTKNFRQLKKLFLLLLTVLPYAAISIAYMTISPTQATDQMQTVLSPFTIFKDYFGTGAYAAIYIVAIIYSLVKGGSAQKLLASVAIFMILTFLNPAVGLVMGSVPVYWRFYWLIPGLIMTAWMGADIMTAISGRKRIALGALALLCIVVSGGFMFNESNFTLIQNKYKLPSAVVNIANAVNNDKTEPQPVLLLPDEVSAKVRQYDSDNRVLISRGYYTKSGYEAVGEGDKYNQIVLIYNTLYSHTGQLTAGGLNDQINEFDISYIVMPKETSETQLLLDAGMVLLGETDGYWIYKRA